MKECANKPRDKTRWRRLVRKHGQGLVEYSMIILFVALVIIIILTFIGQQVFNNMYSKIASSMPNP